MAIAFHGCEYLPEPGHIDISVKVEIAINRIASVKRRYPYMEIAFSGGKDSIVVAHLAREHHGINTGVMDTSLYFERDLDDYRLAGKQLGIDLDITNQLDWNWITINPEFIFMPKKLLGRYYGLRQQKSIRKHWLAHDKPCLLLGRRTEENSVSGAFSSRSDGMKQCFPIFDWSGDDVWQYIVDNNLFYPNIYRNRIGKIEGATSWPEISLERWSDFGEDPLPLIDNYQPGLLKDLAQYSEPVRRYLDGQ